eukprot:8609136-Pyramimonas_sp.AAC.1
MAADRRPRQGLDKGAQGSHWGSLGTYTHRGLSLPPQSIELRTRLTCPEPSVNPRLSVHIAQRVHYA